MKKTTSIYKIKDVQREERSATDKTTEDTDEETERNTLETREPTASEVLHDESSEEDYAIMTDTSSTSQADINLQIVGRPIDDKIKILPPQQYEGPSDKTLLKLQVMGQFGVSSESQLSDADSVGTSHSSLNLAIVGLPLAKLETPSIETLKDEDMQNQEMERASQETLRSEESVEGPRINVTNIIFTEETKQLKPVIQVIKEVKPRQAEAQKELTIGDCICEVEITKEEEATEDIIGDLVNLERVSRRTEDQTQVFAVQKVENNKTDNMILKMDNNKPYLTIQKSKDTKPYVKTEKVKQDGGQSLHISKDTSPEKLLTKGQNETADKMKPTAEENKLPLAEEVKKEQPVGKVEVEMLTSQSKENTMNKELTTVESIPTTELLTVGNEDAKKEEEKQEDTEEIEEEEEKECCEVPCCPSSINKELSAQTFDMTIEEQAKQLAAESIKEEKMKAQEKKKAEEKMKIEDSLVLTAGAKEPGATATAAAAGKTPEEQIKPPIIVIPLPRNIAPKDAAVQVPELNAKKLKELEEARLMKGKKDAPLVGNRDVRFLNAGDNPNKKYAQQIEDIVDDEDEDERRNITNKYRKVKIPPYDLMTGFLSDGVRRVDYVLVFNMTSPPAVKSAQLQFLVNLVKMGLVVEIDGAVRKRNQHLQFVKLHATDALLDTYGDAFRVHRYYSESHMQYIHRYKRTLWYKSRCTRREREYLRVVRSYYREPLMLSNLERSYIVYLLLRCQPFGQPANYCGLQRMLNHKLIVDAYALHDGPYYHPQQKEFKEFNCRQVLYLFWAGLDNFTRYQPLHLIREYYGTRVAFYFMFYEFYNKALIIASIWGIFMTILYFIKDNDYIGPVRKMICDATYATNNKFIKPSDIQCEECVGVTRDNRCPMKHVKDQCYDMKILRFADSPYIIIYSFGMCIWVTFFLCFWSRTQCYWQWMWETVHIPTHKIVRPEVEIQKPNIQRDTASNIAGNKKKTNVGVLIGQGISIAARSTVLNVFLPTLAIFILICMLIFFMYVFTEVARPWSVKKVTLNMTLKDYRALPIINRKKDFNYLALAVLLFSLLAYCFEMLFHRLASKATNLQNFKSFNSFEETLIIHYFWYSFFFGTIFVVYFAWLKGLFYTSPVELTDLNIKSSLKARVVSYNLTARSPRFAKLMLRFITWNCGGFLSCLREAIIIYITVVFFRIYVVGLGECIYSKIVDVIHKRGQLGADPIPTTEREFSLRPISEEDIIVDMNKVLVQFALIALFTPLCPLAPILAFIHNILHIRRKARAYVVNCRRVVVVRAKGINYWNMMLRLICFATPICQAIIMTQTGIFKKYGFYKQTRNKMEPIFIRYLLSGVINRTRFAIADPPPGVDNTTTPAARAPAAGRSAPELFYRDKAINQLYSTNNYKTYNMVKECHIDALIKNYGSPGGVTYKWPFSWDFIEDNRTYSYYETEHYYVKCIKVVFVLFFVHTVALVAVELWGLFGARPAAAEIGALRERRLRTVRLHYLRPATRVLREKL